MRLELIQCSLSIVFVYTLLNVKTVLFQAIQFSISTQFSSIWPIYKPLSGTTTLGQSGPGSDGNERVLSILQSRNAVGVFYCSSRLGNAIVSFKIVSVENFFKKFWIVLKHETHPKFFMSQVKYDMKRIKNKKD